MLFLCILHFVVSSLAASLGDYRDNSTDVDNITKRGDILLPKEQIEAAVNGQDPTNVGGARGLHKYGRWPGGNVYYTIATSRPFKKHYIYNAIKEWESKTCIRFYPRTNQKDYIRFYVGAGASCHSTGVGHRGGKQRISLGFGCIGLGIATHEIGHALGFCHEQSRPDRDRYVDIIWENIPEDKHSQFSKYSVGTIDSLGVPYDYESIMHYRKHDFAKWPWQVTIRTKKPGANIGHKRHLSPLDVKQMNLYYNCNKK